MKAVVVSAASPHDIPLSRMMAALQAELERAGFDNIERYDVADQKLGFCQGEFDCWLKHPGRCKINDAVQPIAAAIPSADALVFAGRVAFGGFDHREKLAIDRLIGLVLPFFEQRAALTHHERRYAERWRLHSVGLLASPDAEQAETFDALNDANAINLSASGRSAAVLEESRPEPWQSSIRQMLETPLLPPGYAITDRAALREELLSVARPPLLPAFAPVRTAALLVGSAKPQGTSSSELLAREFARLLGAEGVSCKFFRATQFVHETPAAVAAATELAAADLFLLATPLYVDSLPALVTHALELVARVRSERRDALFVPLVQCGFPEPEQVRTALDITRHFAKAAGYQYAGALPLGAGGIVTPERSLAAGRPPVHQVARALRLAAPALAAGESVPEAALREILTRPMPESVYRFAGELSFRLEAHRRGTAQRNLRARPFSPSR